MAAGYATRLYPLTKEYPKPLLEVKNKPIINYIINNLNSVKSIDELIVVTNSKFIGKFRQWKLGLKGQKKITLVDDRTKSNEDRLGAIGDINFVLRNSRIKDDLLVIGGDNLFSGNLNEFVNFALKNKPNTTIGAYRLKNKRDANKYGVLKVDKNHQVVEFEEKPKRPNSPLVAMCLYYIPREQFSLIGNYMKFNKNKVDATGKYIDWLKKKADIFCFVFKGSWFDIGDHKYLAAAKKGF